MILSEEHKTVFFRIPKTGTTSLTKVLTDNGFHTPDEYMSTYHDPLFRCYHCTPEVAIKEGWLTDEMLDSWNFYTFFRHPVERLFSAWLMAYRNNLEEEVMNDRISRWEFKAVPPLLLEPQYKWLMPVGAVCRLLDFDDFGNELKMVFDDLDLPLDDVPQLNVRHTRKWQEHISTTNQELIAEKYATDMKIWKELKDARRQSEQGETEESDS